MVYKNLSMLKIIYANEDHFSIFASRSMVLRRPSNIVSI